MTHPVSVSVVVDDLALLLTLSEHVAQDLIAGAKAANKGDDPVSARKIERDTLEARQLLETANRVRLAVTL